jgi:hypothetical protein
MTFQLTIHCDNAAFTGDDDDPRTPQEQAAPELARILRRIANQIEGGATERPVRDINGNNVGHWSF